jgi:hypothetical protein
MAWVYSPGGDYHRARGAWLIANAGASDLVLTADNDVFSRYLRYWSSAEVVNLLRYSEADLDRLAERIRTRTGACYVVDDALSVASAVCAEDPDACSAYRKLITTVRSPANVVSNTEAGNIYRVPGR